MRRELNTPQVDNDLNDPYNPVAPHAGYKRERFVYASVPSRIWEMPQYSAATTTKQLSLEPQTSVAVDVAAKKAQAVKDYADLVQEMQNYAAAVRETRSARRGKPSPTRRASGGDAGAGRQRF